MQALRASHVALVRAYVAARRSEVDRFVREEWLPLHARHVLEEPASEQKKLNALAEDIEELGGVVLKLLAKLV